MKENFTINQFTPIDMKTWYNAQEFWYYTQSAPTSYTINVTFDITVMRNRLKKEGLKFFPAYLYLITRQICRQEQFRVGLNDDILGHWSSLTPAFPQFHDDDKTTSLLFTDFDNDFRTFYANYITDTTTYGSDHGIITKKGIPPKNTYIISCIPWFSFNSFSLHNHGIKDYYFPSFEAGAFTEQNEKITMPLSITVHHATVDGYHLKVFIEELQAAMNNPDEWL